MIGYTCTVYVLKLAIKRIFCWGEQFGKSSYGLYTTTVSYLSKI
jgi:hypothetical protein